MKILICDNSVVLKWFNTTGERYTRQAKQILKECVEGKWKLTEPDFMLAELANALLLGKKLPVAGVIRAIKRFLEVDPTMVAVDSELVSLATKISEKQQITIYDALYVALAKRVGGMLVSDDSVHHGKIKDKAIKMLSEWK